MNKKENTLMIHPQHKLGKTEASQVETNLQRAFRFGVFLHVEAATVDNGYPLIYTV